MCQAGVLWGGPRIHWGEPSSLFFSLSLFDLIMEKGSIWCSRVLNTCLSPNWLPLKPRQPLAGHTWLE